MSSNLDALIEQKEAQLAPLRQRMEEIKNQFINQTVSFASEWYKKTVNQYVTKYPEVTLNMKEEQIATMKNQVNTLVNNTETIVKKELDNPALWWHLKPHLHDSINQYLQIADKYPEIIDQAVRHILGQLGTILEEHKFHVTASGNTGTYQEFWFEQPIGSQQTVPCYPHLLEWSKEMQATLKEYNTLFTQAMEQYKVIQRLKDEKKKQQAMTRWNSI
jgi:hypothetical protein